MTEFICLTCWDFSIRDKKDCPFCGSLEVIPTSTPRGVLQLKESMRLVRKRTSLGKSYILSSGEFSYIHPLIPSHEGYSSRNNGPAHIKPSGYELYSFYSDLMIEIFADGDICINDDSL